jgi:hypothetical protein
MDFILPTNEVSRHSGAAQMSLWGSECQDLWVGAAPTQR